jgi:hypothetical protein
MQPRFKKPFEPMIEFLMIFSLIAKYCVEYAYTFMIFKSIIKILKFLWPKDMLHYTTM